MPSQIDPPDFEMLAELGIGQIDFGPEPGECWFFISDEEMNRLEPEVREQTGLESWHWALSDPANRPLPEYDDPPDPPQ